MFLEIQNLREKFEIDSTKIDIHVEHEIIDYPFKGEEGNPNRFK